MTNKDFDCVEMKRRGAEAVRERLKNKTFEEKVEYWRRRTEELRASVEKAREAKERNAVKP